MTPSEPPRDDPDRTLPTDEDRTIPSDPRVVSAPTPLPDSIGSYTILGKLGEGGMGIVYEAEQHSPRRKVALKVVLGGARVTELSVRLFQREAETLGRLEHPGIGAIYESGRTAEGQHFFAMELVRGETLDEHIRRHGEEPSREQIRYRLDLFRKVCDAVSYAHQRAVIHRDLKPSNVLVTEDGQPKVLDFGLARITDADTEAVTMVSEVGAIKGTLPYMSPEQTRGNPDEVDVRADVYSLGVILYRLITGQLPYDTARSGIVEAIRVITEDDPAPFRSISSVGKLAGGDLETIVRKALEKDPEERFQSVVALSEDLERYLTDQPIQARPPSAVYQLKKLVQRNRLPFATAGTFVLLVIGFGIWMSVLFTRAEVAREESEAVTGFLSDMLAAVDPQEEGRDVTVRQVLDEAAGRVDQEFVDRPQVQRRLMRTMGVVYFHLGVYAEAESLLTGVIASLETEHGREAGELLEPLAEMAILLTEAGEYGRAEDCYERILAIEERVLGFDRPEYAGTLNNLAVLHWKRGEFDRAREVYERVLAVKSETLDPEDPSLVAPLNNLGILYQETGRPEKAREAYERALRIKEAEVGPDHPAIASILNGIGVLAWSNGDPEGARAPLERALAIREQALGPDHPETALALNNLGILHREEGRLELAQEFFSRALEIRLRTLGPDHPQLARSYRAIGGLQKDLGNLVEAESSLKRALAIQEKSLGSDHPDHASAALALAEVYDEEGRDDEARVLIDDALRVLREKLGPDSPEYLGGLEQSAELHRKVGRPDLAREEETRITSLRRSSAE